LPEEYYYQKKNDDGAKSKQLVRIEREDCRDTGSRPLIKC